MGDTPRKLPDSFHLLGLSQASLALPQCLFDMHAVAQVVDHAGEITLALRGELAD